MLASLGVGNAPPGGGRSPTTPSKRRTSDGGRTSGIPRAETPYGQWQTTLITDPECMPVAHDLKHFVEQDAGTRVHPHNDQQPTTPC